MSLGESSKNTDWLFPKGQFFDWKFPFRQFSQQIIPRRDISLMDSSPNDTSPNGQFQSRHFPESHIHFTNKKVIDFNYVISEDSVSAITTENTTKRNDTFSISLFELLVLLKTFRNLWFFLLNLYSRKLKTRHIHMILHIKLTFFNRLRTR